MKIKTLEFRISNYAGNETAHTTYDNTGSNATELIESLKDYPLATTADVDKAVNKFIADKDIVDIKPAYYTIDQHNNGGYDTVIARYTIIYK